MNIAWTEPAFADVEGIREFIRRDSAYYANRFVERIVGAVESLANLPERGRRVPEADREDIREILFANYRIIYRIDVERILVLAVIHGARDITQMTPKPWDIS